MGYLNTEDKNVDYLSFHHLNPGDKVIIHNAHNYNNYDDDYDKEYKEYGIFIIKSNGERLSKNGQRFLSVEGIDGYWFEKNDGQYIDPAPGKPPKYFSLYQHTKLKHWTQEREDEINRNIEKQKQYNYLTDYDWDTLPSEFLGSLIEILKGQE